MQRLLGLFVLLLGVLPALSLSACSSGQKAYIPVDSAVRTWQPPDPDTYAPPPAPAAPPAAAEKPAEKPVAKEAAKKK